MREPSLHILKSDLVSVLSKTLGYDGDQATGLANEILHQAKAFSVGTRSITISTKRLENKAKQQIVSSRNDANLMADMVLHTRRQLKHRGLTQIKPGSKEWGVIKQMAAQANDFCNEFELTKRSGYIKYLEIGLSKMKKYSPYKFINMYETICITQQALVEIEKDSDPETTKDMYKIYSQRIIENTGIYDRLEELPDKYVWFVRAREEAEKLNISIKVYMAAQFQFLDFARGIPHPAQFVGATAVERVIRYCYENGIKIK